VLFVFNTNTLVSATLKPQGSAMQAIRTAQRVGILVFSTETKNEILDVIPRSKFDKYLPAAERLKTIREVILKARLMEVTSADRIECRDPTDVKFLRLAWEAQAHCLVSGDADLKVLNPFRGIPILSIAEFNSVFNAL
jgi:uncharacterized protein